MDKDIKTDLKINGTGSTSGGSFNEVVINGVGNVNGNLECFSFKSNGVSNVTGDMKSQSVKVNGTSNMIGNIESDEFKINGSADVRGNIKSKESKVHGELKLTGSLDSEIVELHGGMSVSGDCNAERFASRGGFSISGMLSADEIDIRLHGKCSAKEIGGEKITVKLGNEFTLKRFIKSIFPSWDLNSKLTADMIEGDDIELEETKAKIVRGNNVTIGRGCEIDLVEYKNTFNLADNNSRVKENKKT